MNRSTRAEQASQTVAIVERGSYEAPAGRVVDVAAAVRACLDATRFHAPEELERMSGEILGDPSPRASTVFELVNETTLAGIARVLADGAGPVAALNFASARNPGGGFLNGSHAQEESLARSSALYASQMQAWEFYERHRDSASLLYSDAMIVSPACPIVRDDDGTLLDEPRAATFLTCAAPNAGAIKQAGELARVPEVVRRRSGLILAVAAARGYRQLVLGAWGCGVFRNDPRVVASAFLGHLKGGVWSGRFDRVVFSVLDTSPGRGTFEAFRRAMDGGP